MAMDEDDEDDNPHIHAQVTDIVSRILKEYERGKEKFFKGIADCCFLCMCMYIYMCVCVCVCL